LCSGSRTPNSASLHWGLLASQDAPMAQSESGAHEKFLKRPKTTQITKSASMQGFKKGRKNISYVLAIDEVCFITLPPFRQSEESEGNRNRHFGKTEAFAILS
jgi:hypothetical protein